MIQLPYIHSLASTLRATASMPQDFPSAPPNAWDTWPFSLGAPESTLFMVSKGLFLLAIFVVIVAFVRYLFGPGGWLAEPWMREEWEAQRQAELQELQASFQRGEMDETKYQKRRAKILRRKV